MRAEELDLPVFYQPWYLDSVCIEGYWDVAIVQKNKAIIGIWPYFIKKRFVFDYMTQPSLTPYLGPIVLIPDSITKSHSQLSWNKRILSELADALPNNYWQIVHCSPRLINWQPLSWKGFRQTSRWTYCIDLTVSLENIKADLADKTRNQIKNNSGDIQIKKSEDVSLLYDLIVATYRRQKLFPPYAKEVLTSLHRALVINDAGSMLMAYYNDQPVAATYVISDRTNAYLSITARADNAPAGIISSLIWENILSSKIQGKIKFDFEGSMISSIESYFRSFGGRPVTYNRIYRTSNKLVLLLLQMFNRL